MSLQSGAQQTDEAAAAADKALSTLLAQRPRSAWRTLALNQARRLYDDLRAARAQGPVDPFVAQLVCENLVRAAGAATSASRNFFVRWISGSDIETAWAALHVAEEHLLDVQPVAEVRRRLPGIDTALRSNLQTDDPRLASYTRRLAELKGAPDAEIEGSRAQIRGFLADSNAASDAAHANVHSARNRLSLIGTITLVFLVLTSVIHALAPGFIDLSVKGGGDAPEAWWVIIVGGIGGVIGALASVWRVAAAPSEDLLPTYQALIRIPMGGAAGLAGAMLIQAQFITALKPQATLALLGYALAIGYTPDILLKYLDRRLTSVLDQARGKDDPARPKLSQPSAPSSGGASTAVRRQPPASRQAPGSSAPPPPQ